MKRRICKLALFLLLGAILNVAVAWGCALWIVAPNNSGNPLVSGYQMDDSTRVVEPFNGTQNSFKLWLLRRVRKPGGAHVVITIVPGPDFVVTKQPTAEERSANASFEKWLPPQCTPGDLHEREAEFRANGTFPGFFYWYARGWPCLSLACWWPWFQHAEWPSPQVSSGFQFSHPTTTSPWPYNVHDLRALPLHPLWPGFAINTVFYAAILWLLVACPFALRRRRRIKRGLCPECAYPVGTNSVCTECGRAVNR